MHAMRAPLRPQRRLRLGVFAAVVAICTTIAPASAAGQPPPGAQTDDGSPVVLRTAVSDRDDVGGRLDLARVADREVMINRRHVVVSYRVRTFTTWGSQRLNDTERNFVLELNRDDERGSERNVTVSSVDGALTASVISNATREVIATVTVTRPDDQSFVIAGPRRLIGARSYFWTSNFHADRSHRCGNLDDGTPLTCQDSVPDRGWIRMSWPAWP